MSIFRNFSLVFVLFCLSSLFSQEKAFQIYNAKGKKISYAKMQKAVLAKQFVFFGELHNNAIAHWLQLEILEDLHQKYGANLMCGSEMFERDNQALLTQFMKKEITDKQFEDSCRLWTNYKTDYKPMLLFAQANQIPWIATNVPRRFASLVYKKGTEALDSLSDVEKTWICPLPFPIDTTLSQYAALTNGAMHMGENFVKAQAIKDATMGHSIVLNKKENSVFYHLNGSYHSDFHQSILWYLNFYGKVPYSDMLTISTVTQDEIDSLSEEFIGKADFIICVPEKMTNTH